MPVFDEIRTWPGIREPKPGIFYFKSKPFLHFHIKNGKRWADIRAAGDWENIDAPTPLSAKHLKVLNSAIKRHYEDL